MRLRFLTIAGFVLPLVPALFWPVGVPTEPAGQPLPRIPGKVESALHDFATLSAKMHHPLGPGPESGPGPGPESRSLEPEARPTPAQPAARSAPARLELLGVLYEPASEERTALIRDDLGRTTLAVTDVETGPPHARFRIVEIEPDGVTLERLPGGVRLRLRMPGRRGDAP